MTEIIENYKRILIQIERYNKEFSATSKNPKLIAVSKTFSEDKIQLVIDQGQLFLEKIRFKRQLKNG